MGELDRPKGMYPPLPLLRDLEVIEQENRVENARVVGAHLHRGLESLAAKHAIIGGVCGRGFFTGAGF